MLPLDEQSNHPLLHNTLTLHLPSHSQNKALLKRSTLAQMQMEQTFGKALLRLNNQTFLCSQATMSAEVISLVENLRLMVSLLTLSKQTRLLFRG